MKKFLINALLLVVTLSANAQSKQDLQNTINNLNQQVGQLKAMLDAKSEQLDQANQTIADLRQKLASGAAAAQKPATYRDSIADLIEKYTNCASWQETLKYVMEPERVRPIMQKYYAGNGFSPTIWTAKEILKEAFRRFNGKNHTIYRCVNFYAVQTPEGYRIDWEATVEYNPVSLDDLNGKVGQTAEIRTCFNSIEADNSNDTWRCYYCRDYYLFTKTGTALDQQLYKMQDSDKILKVKYMSDNQGSYFLVTDIVSTSFSKY